MIDSAVFALINGFAGKNWLIDHLFILATNFGFLAIIAIIFYSRKKKAVIHSAVSAFIGILISEIIKSIPYLYRARPFIENKANLLVTGYPTSSFPSGHTIFSFALATPLIYFNKKLGIIALVIAFFVGLSRIFVGVHYPSDVLAGIIFSFFAVLISRYLIKIKTSN